METPEALIRQALDDLDRSTYAEVADRYGVSHGTIYRWALSRGRRKNEQRIQERKRARRARREAFLQEVLNSITTADVIDFLDGLPDNAIDLHATSIPYNCDKPYGGNRGEDSKAHHFYIGWMLQVFSEMARTLKHGGVAFLNMGATQDDNGAIRPLDTVFMSYLQAIGLTYQNRVIWEIPHGLTPKRRLAGRYETVLIFSKGEPETFNPSSARTPQKNPGKRAYKGPRKGQLSGHPLGAWPSDVWRDIGNVGANHPEKTGHPAQFPAELVRRAIRLYTVPGDLVCDVFDGSGTTTSTAKEEHRSTIGCDLFYEDLRRQRYARAAGVDYCALPGVSEESLAVWQAEAIVVGSVDKSASAETRQLLSEQL